MSHLISTYAAACGLRIDKPEVLETFYALPFAKYLTIQTGSGQGAKNYDFFQEVVVLIKSILDKEGITIVHLGGKDDPALQGVCDLRGKTTVAQAQYVLKRGLVHVGNDSWMVHCAGWNKHPLVAVYGSTSVQNHGPYWKDPERTILISSHRHGGVPTYVANENPKEINVVPPEQVANAVLGLLHLGPALPQQSRFYGLLYQHALFEVVPNSFPSPSFVPEASMIVRMDYLFNEEVLTNLLRTGRKINIITNRPIDLNILGTFRGQILSYTHEVDLACPAQYAATLRSILPHHSFFTKEKDDAKVADLRYQFFDIVNVDRANDLTREDYVKAALSYLNCDESKTLDILTEISDNKLRFKTNRYILSDGKIYLSRAHLRAGLHIDSLLANEAAVIDAPDWFEGLNHYGILYHP